MFVIISIFLVVVITTPRFFKIVTLNSVDSMFFWSYPCGHKNTNMYFEKISSPKMSDALTNVGKNVHTCEEAWEEVNKLDFTWSIGGIFRDATLIMQFPKIPLCMMKEKICL